MGLVAAITNWLREAITGQPWLAPVHSYIDRAPGWAFWAAPMVLLLSAIIIFRPRKRSTPRQTSQPQGEAEVKPVGSGANVSAQRPSGKPPSSPAKSSAKPAPTDDDDSRAVRVFVSSTFLDMQRERDVLVRQTFPALRTKFRARGVELLEVDLRWGITQEQSESGQTLPTLLAEIDRCRPYFIGLLGERYGWVPHESALTDELKAAYPSIAGATSCSVTELEIIHGVLSNPECAKRAIFLERDPAWLETQTTEERAIYVAESEEAQAKLAYLKARIRASGAKIIPYTKPDDIGAAVEAALVERIEAQFPEADAPDAFTQTARLHAAYARERRGLHIGAGHYMSALDAWIDQAGAKPMLITGASGGGKSTLVANWLAQHRSATPSDIVFEHYLGASPDSADPIQLIRRLWEHLNRTIGENLDQPSDERALVDGLPQLFAQAHAFVERLGGNVLIALDGLDKLASQKDLRWLPTYLPPRVRLLASSLEGDTRTAADVRGWATLEVKPLTNTERRDFIETSLKAWGRSLSQERTDRILASGLSGSPLFLKTLLDELRVAGIERALDARLNEYLAARDIPDLFERVLNRLEGDCGDTFVRSAASLIWASRAGLEEAEITAITRATPIAWATLRNGLGDALRDQGGRIAFSHDFLRQAVEIRYVPTDEEKDATHLTIADHFESRVADLRHAEELPFQLRAAKQWDRLEGLLLDLERFLLLRAAGDAELRSYWDALANRGSLPEPRLTEALSRQLPDISAWTTSDAVLVENALSFLRFAGARSAETLRLHADLVQASHRLLGPSNETTLNRAIELAASHYERGDLADARRVEEGTLDDLLRRYPEDHPLTLTSRANLARTLHDQGLVNQAYELEQTVLAARRRVLGPLHPDTLSSMGNLAYSLYSLGKLKAAESLERETVELRERTLGSDHPHTITAKANLAVTLHHNGALLDALALERQVLSASNSLLGAKHPDTLMAMANLATTLHALGQFNEARALEEEVLSERRSILSGEHPDTLRAMGNLARTLRSVGDIDNSRSMFELVYHIRSDVLGKDHAETLRTAFELALCDKAAGDLERALVGIADVLEERNRVLGEAHPDVVKTVIALAETLEATSQFEAAARQLERAISLCDQIFEDEHPDRRRAEVALARVAEQIAHPRT